ncbi:sigma-70 family RNA polymerase sigma factor [Haliangium sp.]|uniref:sigma-70 family RNA polymerase sigma factor n=1 Tax=Haliangium sp. TaxID=2663208 RepID=UPI003D0EBCE8
MTPSSLPHTATPAADAGALWRRFHAELSAFVRPRVASDEAAGDILQSAFLRAHKSLLAGEVPEHPRAWLYQIVRHLIVDSHRHARRRQALAEAVANQPATEPEPFGWDDERIAFALVARSLPMFIEQLEPHYRDALRLTELEGLTQAEAAKRLGISVSGMKSRVQRGRKLVFAALQRCCEFEIDARGRMIACTSRANGGGCG